MLKVIGGSSQSVSGEISSMGEGLTSCMSHSLPSGISLAVVKGDITRIDCDVIVNAANERMDHIGGLARDIVSKGIDFD